MAKKKAPASLDGTAQETAQDVREPEPSEPSVAPVAPLPAPVAEVLTLEVLDDGQYVRFGVPYVLRAGARVSAPHYDMEAIRVAVARGLLTVREV